MNSETIIRERPGTIQRKQELLENIEAYVDANLDRRITLQMIAEEFRVSISTVTQLFQHRSDTTFHQFLTKRRMAAAEELIARNVPLEEVGKQLGYTDHSSFYRAFKQHYGVAPRDFRRGTKD